jgi:hypothetical protein
MDLDNEFFLLYALFLPFSPFSIVHFYHNIILPYTINYFPFQICKLSLSIDPILMEITLKELAVLEHYGSMTLLEVVLKLAFVVYPLFLQIVEVGIVE